MTPVEYVTVAISALAIVTRIVFFIRNPHVTTPTEMWAADHPQMWLADHPKLKELK